MQIKGAIKFLAGALAIICIYYLSFTWITTRIYNDAEKYAIEYAANHPDENIELNDL
jgi:SecD/SecF fusion protein